MKTEMTMNLTHADAGVLLLAEVEMKKVYKNAYAGAMNTAEETKYMNRINAADEMIETLTNIVYRGELDAITEVVITLNDVEILKRGIKRVRRDAKNDYIKAENAEDEAEAIEEIKTCDYFTDAFGMFLAEVETEKAEIAEAINAHLEGKHAETDNEPYEAETNE